MKIKLNKDTRKRVKQFQNLIGFKKPYQIIADSIDESLKVRMDPKHLIEEQLNDVTHCQMDEIHQGYWIKKTTQEKRNLNLTNLSGTRLVMKKLNRINCNHKEKLSSIDCITNVISNYSLKYLESCQKPKYWILSQNNLVYDKISKKINFLLPCFKINHNSLYLFPFKNFKDSYLIPVVFVLIILGLLLFFYLFI